MSTRGTTIYGTQMLADDTTNITAATTLTQSDSGKVLYLKAAAGAAVTLPAPADGFKVKIITGQAFATTAWTIVSTGANVRGGAIVNSVFVASAGTTTITLSASAETIGDFVELTSDGTSYFVTGIGAVASSIAFS